MGRGRASTFAAVTVVNALATGLGAALSIDMRLEAFVEVGEGYGLHVKFEGFRPKDSRLIKACLS
ncbi:MAG: hypothetical protein QXW94_06670, partial [Desulfurococcaceae archaeon]